jgi:hypothetical protein
MRNRKYIVYCDPGHAWCKVTRAELEALNIDHKISSCSYVSKCGNFVFLEEDCDLGVFASAKENRGESVEFDVRHTNKASKIRGYDRFVPLKSYLVTSSTQYAPAPQAAFERFTAPNHATARAIARDFAARITAYGYSPKFTLRHNGEII